MSTTTPSSTPPWGTLEAVDLGDGRTWTLADDFLPGDRRVVTSFSTVRFAPAWSMPGDPHHFETLVFEGQRDTECHTYATEPQARDGHAVIVSRLRSLIELAQGVQS